METVYIYTINPIATVDRVKSLTYNGNFGEIGSVGIKETQTMVDSAVFDLSVQDCQFTHVTPAIAADVKSFREVFQYLTVLYNEV